MAGSVGSAPTYLRQIFHLCRRPLELRLVARESWASTVLLGHTLSTIGHLSTTTYNGSGQTWPRYQVAMVWLVQLFSFCVQLTR